MRLSQFLCIARGVDTMPILLELQRHPDLWEVNNHRETYPGTPHGDTQSVWVRYRAANEIEGLESFQEEHRNVFWPAWQALPSLRPLVFGLMAKVAAVELGSILITRLRPGGEVKRHSDAGSWAPCFYNCKCHVTLAGTSLSECDSETVRMIAGDVWTFDNLLPHAVSNDGDTDRLVAIVSMRTE